LVQFPSLNAFRVFETVARKGSFKLAADDLYVTQSAVSQQVKQLEEQLGQKLFIRQPGRLILTASGEVLLPAVSQAFGLIGDALEKIDIGNRIIRIYASTSFATRWLIPRFASFESQFPTINIRVNVGDKPDLSVDMIDLEIAYSFGSLSRDNAIPLMDEWVLPVCAPHHPAASSPNSEALMQHRLLLNSPDGKDWRLWARENSIEPDFDIAFKRAMKLSTDAAAIELALSGFGVALVNLHYAINHLEEKRLVPALYIRPLKLGTHYLCVHSPLEAVSRMMCDWLSVQAKESFNRIGLYIDPRG